MKALSPAAPAEAYGFRCGRLLLAVGVAAWVAGMPAAAPAAAPVVILTPGEPGEAGSRFVERLKDALAPATDVTLQPSVGGPAVLARVAADAAQVAFAHRDALVAFGRADHELRNALEMYGNIPACVVTLVRPGSALRAHADLAGARRDGEPVTIDVGVRDGWSAATFAILRELDPAVAHITTEHRGGARALSRVLSGETDALMAIAYDGALDGPLAEAVAAGTLEPVSLLGTALPRVAALYGLPYETAQIEIGRPGWLRAAGSYDTLCTALGVVVSTRAEPGAAEAIARAAVSGRLASRNRGWLRDAVAYAGDAVARTAVEAQRVAASIVEPGLAWITRVVLPADPNGNKAGVRPASNLKDDGQ